MMKGETQQSMQHTGETSGLAEGLNLQSIDGTQASTMDGSPVMRTPSPPALQNVNDLITHLYNLGHPRGVKPGNTEEILSEINLIVFFVYILNKYYNSESGQPLDLVKILSGCWIVVKEETTDDMNPKTPLFNYFYNMYSMASESLADRFIIMNNNKKKSSHGLNKTLKPFGQHLTPKIAYKDINEQININEEIGNCSDLSRFGGNGDEGRPGNIALVMGYQNVSTGAGMFNAPYSYTWFQTENAGASGIKGTVQHGKDFVKYKQTGLNIGPCSAECGQTEAQFYRSPEIKNSFSNGTELKDEGEFNEDFPPIILVPKVVGKGPNIGNINQDLDEFTSIAGDRGSVRKRTLNKRKYKSKRKSRGESKTKKSKTKKSKTKKSKTKKSTKNLNKKRKKAKKRKKGKTRKNSN